MQGVRTHEETEERVVRKVASVRQKSRNSDPGLETGTLRLARDRVP